MTDSLRDQIARDEIAQILQGHIPVKLLDSRVLCCCDDLDGDADARIVYAGPVFHRQHVAERILEALVAFPQLEGRPAALTYEEIDVVLDWYEDHMSAVDVRWHTSCDHLAAKLRGMRLIAGTSGEGHTPAPTADEAAEEAFDAWWKPLVPTEPGALRNTFLETFQAGWNARGEVGHD